MAAGLPDYVCHARVPLSPARCLQDVCRLPGASPPFLVCCPLAHTGPFAVHSICSYVLNGVLQITEEFVGRMLAQSMPATAAGQPRRGAAHAATHAAAHASDDDMKFFLVSQLPLSAIQRVYKVRRVMSRGVRCPTRVR